MIFEAKITGRDGIQLTTVAVNTFTGAGFEHRLAHCLDGGPPGGYYIRWGGAEIPKEMI